MRSALSSCPAPPETTAPQRNRIHFLASRLNSGMSKGSPQVSIACSKDTGILHQSVRHLGFCLWSHEGKMAQVLSQSVDQWDIMRLKRCWWQVCASRCHQHKHLPTIRRFLHKDSPTGPEVNTEWLYLFTNLNCQLPFFP